MSPLSRPSTIVTSFETAVFLLANLYGWRVQVTDFVIFYVCHNLFLLCFNFFCFSLWLFCLGSSLCCTVLASVLCVCNSVLVKSNGEEADDALVTVILGFKDVYKLRVGLEFNKVIES